VNFIDEFGRKLTNKFLYVCISCFFLYTINALSNNFFTDMLRGRAAAGYGSLGDSRDSQYDGNNTISKVFSHAA
jgi:hypothetical protein